MDYLDERKEIWQYINHYIHFPYKIIYIKYMSLANILLTLECLLLVVSMSSGSIILSSLHVL